MLEFFINSAHAADPGSQGGIISLIPLLILFLVFYFFLIRPQMKQAKTQKKMIESLAKNDEVVTNGGLLGKIMRVDDSFITLKIAEDIEVRVQKNAISTMMPKGTIRNLTNGKSKDK